MHKTSTLVIKQPRMIHAGLIHLIDASRPSSSAPAITPGERPCDDAMKAGAHNRVVMKRGPSLSAATIAHFELKSRCVLPKDGKGFIMA